MRLKTPFGKFSATAVLVAAALAAVVVAVIAYQRQCGGGARAWLEAATDQRSTYFKCPANREWAKNGRCCAFWNDSESCVDPELKSPDWQCPAGKAWHKSGRCCASYSDSTGCVSPEPTADLVARQSGTRRRIDNPEIYGADCVASKGPNVAGRPQPPYSASACSDDGAKSNVCLRGGDGRTWCAGPDDDGSIGWRSVLGAQQDQAVVTNFGDQLGRWGCPLGSKEWEHCCYKEGSGACTPKRWMGRGTPPPPRASTA